MLEAGAAGIDLHAPLPQVLQYVRHAVVHGSQLLPGIQEEPGYAGAARGEKKSAVIQNFISANPWVKMPYFLRPNGSGSS